MSVVVLHDSEAALELQPARKRAPEAAEGLPVRVAEENEVLMLSPLALAAELQPRPIVEGDRLQALEAHRTREPVPGRKNPAHRYRAVD